MLIQTERLLLREFKIDDFLRLFEYQNKTEYLKYYGKQNNKKEEVEKLLKLFISWKNQKPRMNYQFAIEIKNDNRLVGNCGIRKNQKSINSAEIGFELDPNYWHNGYMHEALRAIIEFGIKVIKLNHFYAFCNPNNQRAINLLIKIGFKVTAEIFQENRNRKEVELELQI